MSRWGPPDALVGTTGTPRSGPWSGRPVKEVPIQAGAHVRRCGYEPQIPAPRRRRPRSGTGYRVCTVSWFQWRAALAGRAAGPPQPRVLLHGQADGAGHHAGHQRQAAPGGPVAVRAPPAGISAGSRRRRRHGLHGVPAFSAGPGGTRARGGTVRRLRPRIARAVRSRPRFPPRPRGPCGKRARRPRDPPPPGPATRTG